MANDVPERSPQALSKKVEGLGAPVRLDALVACAACREGHMGYCPNHIVDEGHACPVGWVFDEVERREMESPDKD